MLPAKTFSSVYLANFLNRSQDLVDRLLAKHSSHVCFYLTRGRKRIALLPTPADHRLQELMFSALTRLSYALESGGMGGGTTGLAKSTGNVARPGLSLAPGPSLPHEWEGEPPGWLSQQGAFARPGLSLAPHRKTSFSPTQFQFTAWGPAN